MLNGVKANIATQRRGSGERRPLAPANQGIDAQPRLAVAWVFHLCYSPRGFGGVHLTLTLPFDCDPMAERTDCCRFAPRRSPRMA